MIESMPELSLAAVFLTGLLGGVHCAGMCGGIVSAMGVMQQRPLPNRVNIPVTVMHGSASEGKVQFSGAAAPLTPLTAVSFYNLGRIGTYTLLGALAGGIGSTAWLMQSALPVQQFAYGLSSVLLILMGLYVMGFKGIAAQVEALGRHPWKFVKPFATARLSSSGSGNALVAGSLWGLVPCGMVYAVLSAALVSGSVRQGALLMLAFGLGTLPNLMLLGLSGQWLARASKKRPVRILLGAVIVAFGLLGLMHGMMGPMSGHV